MYGVKGRQMEMIFGGKNWMYGGKWSQKEIALRAWEIKADSLFARKNI